MIFGVPGRAIGELGSGLLIERPFPLLRREWIEDSVLLPVGCFVFLAAGCWWLFLRLFELFQPLLEFSDIESLVGIEIVELKGLRERLLFFEDAIDTLATIGMPSLVLFFHDCDIVIKLKNINKPTMTILLVIAISICEYWQWCYGSLNLFIYLISNI